MTTLIAVFALGVLAKCLWDFLWDALDRRHDRQYAARDTAPMPPIGSPLDEIPANSPATSPKLGLIRTKSAPEGWSAKQVLGYGGGAWGPAVAPTYPGGITAWDRRTDGTVA
jgi:hypothetical protein